MSLLGIHLSILIGPGVPVPAPISISHALESVEVTHNDTGRSGFQMVFRVGRSGPAGLVDYDLMLSPLLRPSSRVVLSVLIGALPRVLFDGFITDQQFTPSLEAGSSRLTVTGEDVSLRMDLGERSAEHPAQDETIIALKLIASYAALGLIPVVLPPPALDPPIPLERTPVQQGTDLAFLQSLAERFGYVFYVTPGPAPLVNTAYWGPPVRAGLPQPALSYNMGAETNLESLSLQHDSLAPTTVEGSVQDRTTNQKIPVMAPASLRPPLASQPTWLVNQPNVRKTQFRQSGLNTVQAFARAQGTVDASTDQTVTVNGELDAVNYGDVLQPRGLVGLRGVGYNYGGDYYVKSVTHRIRVGEYKQSFTLTREGVGALLPVVRP